MCKSVVFLYRLPVAHAMMFQIKCVCVQHCLLKGKTMSKKNVLREDELLDEYAAELVQSIENGATLKDINDIPDDTMDGIYKLAYDFYHQGKLDDAESLFRFLYIYDFYRPDYAMGLAAVLQLKKNYAKAIEFYALAYSLSNDDMRPVFYAGQCNLMLRKLVQARTCFESVIEKSTVETLKEKSSVYLESILKMACASEIS